MALLMKIELNSGIIVDEAYIRIENISGNKEQQQITLNIYFSTDAVNSSKNPVDQRYYNFVPSVDDRSPNFIKQGYEHLKTLDEFKNAIDVL